MAISTVIKRRRSELGLTLLEVANRVNVSEATVQRWESGNIKNLRHDKIARLADALKVSPAHLMGWEDASSPASENNANSNLTQPELQIIDHYRSLNDEGKEKVFEYIDDLVSSGKYIKSDSAELVARENQA